MLWGAIDEIWKTSKVIAADVIEGTTIIAEDIYDGGKIILGLDEDDEEDGVLKSAPVAK